MGGGGAWSFIWKNVLLYVAGQGGLAAGNRYMWRYWVGSRWKATRYTAHLLSRQMMLETYLIQCGSPTCAGTGPKSHIIQRTMNPAFHSYLGRARCVRNVEFVNLWQDIRLSRIYPRQFLCHKFAPDCRLRANISTVSTMWNRVDDLQPSFADMGEIHSVDN